MIQLFFVFKNEKKKINSISFRSLSFFLVFCLFFFSPDFSHFMLSDILIFEIFKRQVTWASLFQCIVSVLIASGALPIVSPTLLLSFSHAPFSFNRIAPSRVAPAMTRLKIREKYEPRDVCVRPRTHRLSFKTKKPEEEKNKQNKTKTKHDFTV